MLLSLRLNLQYMAPTMGMVTADGDCSHKIKRRLLLGRKVMTNLDSIFKSRDITLPTMEQLSPCTATTEPVQSPCCCC